MLVSYDSKNGFNNLLSNLNKVPEVSDNVKKQLQLLNGIDLSNAEVSIKQVADTLKITDSSVIEFMGSMQKSGTVYTNAETALAGYQSHLQSTTKSLSLANIKTKALTVSMKVLSTIGWMAIMTAAIYLLEVNVKAAVQRMRKNY